jgi:hypothetical protein
MAALPTTPHNCSVEVQVSRNAGASGPSQLVGNTIETTTLKCLKVWEKWEVVAEDLDTRPLNLLENLL